MSIDTSTVFMLFYKTRCLSFHDSYRGCMIVFQCFGPHKSSYHSSGSVACRICTFNTPSSGSASWENAPFVRSTCLEPGAQPAQVSTFLTKTHFLGPLQTVKQWTTIRERIIQHEYKRTFEELKAFRLILPTVEGESTCKWFILKATTCKSVWNHVWSTHSRCPARVRPTARV